MPPAGSTAARPGHADSVVTDWSVDPDDWGTFLCETFDLWYQNDLGKVFVNVFESLVADHRQILITSDTYPKELSNIDDRLVSRFNSGLIVAIEPPELEMRVAILLRKAEQGGIRLPEDVAYFVAKHIRQNVRELEGALQRIVHFAGFRNQPIELELV